MNTLIHPTAIVDPRAELDEDVKIGPYSIIGPNTRIARKTKIGPLAVIEEWTEIGHIAHNCLIEDGVVIANAGTLAGYVSVEKKAMIGGLSAVHQYVKIGAYSIIGGCSKVVKDIPPYTKADGHPARLWGLNSVGLQRANFSLKTRNLLKRAYKILFRSALNTTQALEKIENELESDSHVQYLCQFIQNSKRGICKE